jgi:ABC-type nitrate/sulfonate/bicarbonate transport system substrate-binding protein
MQQRYVRVVRLLAFVLLAAVIGACGGAPAAGPSASNNATPGAAGTARTLETTNVSVRLLWVPQYQFAGYIVAKVKGFYDEVGLNVTLNPGGPDISTVQLVGSGSDSFGVDTPDTVLLARERGIPLVALATFFQTSPGGFMVHSDSAIKSPQDFVGKNIAMSPGSLQTEYLGMLAANNIDRSQITEVPYTFNLEPFLSRRVDVWPIYVTDQPNVARKQGADIRVLVARDFGVTMLGDGLFTTEAFLAKNPNTTQAFIDATLKGWDYAVTHFDETVKLLADYNKELTVDQLTFEGHETIKLLQYGVGATCIGGNDRAAWEAEQKMLVDLKILKGPVSLDAALNPSFVTAYYQRKGITCK